jgi:hypothetical protein
MNRFAQNIAAILLLASSLAFASSGESKSDHSLGKRLSDCGAFFGLLSKSESEISSSMRSFAFIATSYSVAAFDDPLQAESENGKSMVSLADELPKLQQDHGALKRKFDTCISALKSAEIEIRPRMNETMKNLVPLIFSGS